MKGQYQDKKINEADRIWISWMDNQGLTHGCELVRCKDCEFRYKEPACSIYTVYQYGNEEFFCANGKQRTS